MRWLLAIDWAWPGISFPTKAIMTMVVMLTIYVTMVSGVGMTPARFDVLKGIVIHNQRNIAAVENSGSLGEARFSGQLVSENE